MLPVPLFNALKEFAGDKELPYYTLTANGVRFHQYVGALQIGPYCIEVLPKIDRVVSDESLAQKVLIDMLRQAGFINVKTPTEATLRLKRNIILDAYIRMFFDELWQIIHKGLVKYYRKEEANRFTLKGRLMFSRHLVLNIHNAERFFVRFSVYDKEHPLNRVLYKTLRLLSSMSLRQEMDSEAKMLLNALPDLGDIEVSEDFFTKIRYTRKTESYKRAIEFARLLLLNYHPDLSRGRNNVLALMFDMNDVWEAWFTSRIAAAAKKSAVNVSVRAQARKVLWTNKSGERVNQRPDIIIDIDDRPEIILDTKWKLIRNRPSEDDLRQMFTYNNLFSVRRSYLVYPGVTDTVEGEFFDPSNNGYCGLSMINFIEEGKLTSVHIDNFLSYLMREAV